MAELLTFENAAALAAAGYISASEYSKVAINTTTGQPGISRKRACDILNSALDGEGKPAARFARVQGRTLTVIPVSCLPDIVRVSVGRPRTKQLPALADSSIQL